MRFKNRFFSLCGDSPGESVWGFFPQLMNYRPAWCLVLGRTQYSYPGVLLCDHNPCYTYFRGKKIVLSRDRDQFIGLCTFFTLHNWRSFFLCSLSDSKKRNLFLQISVWTHIENKVFSISCYAFFSTRLWYIYRNTHFWVVSCFGFLSCCVLLLK